MSKARHWTSSSSSNLTRIREPQTRRFVGDWSVMLVCIEKPARR